MKKWRYCTLILILFALLVLPVTSVQNGKIAFSGVYSINPDKTDMDFLSTGYHPDWSPDGTKIVFENSGIFVMNADGSGVTSLTDNGHSPAWSPDGSKIAFDSSRDGNSEIYVMNADGTDQTRITNNVATDWLPDWSPDSSQIVFVTDRNDNLEIYVMNADGTDPIQLTNNENLDGVTFHKDPAWSPDGSKIAFVILHGSEAAKIWMMNPDGAGQTILPNTGVNPRGPAWSPDGSRIAYHSTQGGSWYQIYVINSDGTEKERITDDYYNEEYPSWGPDALTNVPLNIKIVPKTINLGSKGYFLAFVRLPEAYKGATIDMRTVSCSGAPAVRMMKLKIFPRMVGFVFKTSELNNVEVGKRVTLNVEGELENKGSTYTFTGSDDVKVISKPTWQPDDIKDVSKVSDDQLFKQYSI